MQTETQTETPQYTATKTPNSDRPKFSVQGIEKTAKKFLKAYDVAEEAKTALAQVKQQMLDHANQIRKDLRVREPASLRFLSGENRSVDVVQTRKCKQLPEELKEKVAALPEELRTQLVEEFIVVVLKPRKDILERLKGLRDNIDSGLIKELRAHMDPDESVKPAGKK